MWNLKRLFQIYNCLDESGHVCVCNYIVAHRLRDINIHEFSLMNSGIYNGIYIETVDYFNVLTIHKD